MSMTRFVVWIFSIGIIVPGTGVVSGQSYPSKPIRIIAPDAGSSSDVTARLLAQGITAGLGQQVIIDNRGSGVLSAEPAAKAPPDGYTLLIAGGTFWTFPLLQKTSYDPVKDFVPITTIEQSTNVVAVHPSLPAKSVKELIALAKAKPGELNYGSGPNASSSHLAPALFVHMAGANIVRVPYKSSGQATTALLGGEVHMVVVSATVVAPHHKAGRLRALAVTSAGPSALFPELPPAAATVPGYVSVGVTGIFGRAGTPDAIIRRLNQEMVRYLKTPEAKEKLLAVGAEPVGDTPEELAAFVKSDMEKLGKLIKDIGLTIN